MIPAEPTADPFSESVRQYGAMAAKVERLEELLASARAQAENHLQAKLQAEAMVSKALLAAECVIEAFIVEEEARALRPETALGLGPLTLAASKTRVQAAQELMERIKRLRIG
jgi:hypothetical protein